MASLELRGVPVEFPFAPYECQKDFMSRVIESLQGAKNALLESPTGTGKTLSLLCASLAWQQVFTAALQAERAVVDIQYDEESERLRNAAGELHPPHTRPRPTNLNAGISLPGIGRYEYADAPHFPIENTMGEAGRLPTKPPVVIYASRTHSQLSQVARELKASRYRPLMTVLASREQLCVHPEVRTQQGSAQAHACRALCRARKCGPRLQLDEFLTNFHPFDLPRATLLAGTKVLRVPGASGPSKRTAEAEVFDVEDLASMGREKQVCPYFWTREGPTLAHAQLVLMPYNFLVDSDIREQIPLDWAGSVVIVDEAHNLEAVCADTASFDLTPGQLARAIQEIDTFLEGAIASGGLAGAEGSAAAGGGGGGGGGMVDHALYLKKRLLQLEQILDHAPLPMPKDGPGLVRPGSFLFDVLRRLDITPETWETQSQILLQIAQWLQTRNAVGGASAQMRTNTLALEQIRKQWSQTVRLEAQTPELIQYYRVLIHADVPSAQRGDLDPAALASVGRTLSFLCFSPGVAMAELKTLGVRSIVLTSGTLSPMDSYAAELRLPFPVRLENPHVVGPDQVDLVVVPKGPTGQALNSSFQNRDSATYKQELGMTIANLARIVPGGMLVFFPSYSVMDKAIRFWRGENGGRLWSGIERSKLPIVEARGSAELARQFEDFDQAVDSGRGAVFFAVCRGKVSEGLDFSDARARAVVITGLPFPPVADPKVTLKRRFLDEMRQAAAQSRSMPAAEKLIQSFSRDESAPLLSGQQWYTQQAARAVNQAVGRVIRHRHDWGVILLADERFARPSSLQQLSAWLRPRAATASSFGEVVARLTRFFRHLQETDHRKPVPAAAAGAGSQAVEAASAAIDLGGRGEGGGVEVEEVELVEEEQREVDPAVRRMLNARYKQRKASRLLDVLDRRNAGEGEDARKAAAPPAPTVAGRLMGRLSGAPPRPAGASFAAALERLGQREADSKKENTPGSPVSLPATPADESPSAAAQPPLLRLSQPRKRARENGAEARIQKDEGKEERKQENGGPRPASLYLGQVRQHLQRAGAGESPRYAAFKEVLRALKSNVDFRAGTDEALKAAISRMAQVFGLAPPRKDGGTFGEWQHAVEAWEAEDTATQGQLGSLEDRVNLLRGFLAFLPPKVRERGAFWVEHYAGSARMEDDEGERRKVKETQGGRSEEKLSPRSKRARPEDSIFTEELRYDLITGRPLPPHRRIVLSGEGRRGRGGMGTQSRLWRGAHDRRATRGADDRRATRVASPPRSPSPKMSIPASQPSRSFPSSASSGARGAVGAVIKCPVCLGGSPVMMVAPCGHACCQECWERVLLLKPQCPVCRHHTREKHLTRIFTETSE